MLWARGSVEAGAMVASAREEAVKQAVEEVEQRWKVEKAKWIEMLRGKSIQQAISFGIRFRRSALYRIRQKHLGIDLSGINFKSMEDIDKPDHDDCSGAGGFSRPMPASDSFDSSVLLEDANVVDVDSS